MLGEVPRISLVVHTEADSTGIRRPQEAWLSTFPWIDLPVLGHNPVNVQSGWGGKN